MADDRDEDDPVAELRERFRALERPVPTSRLARLWKTGRSAAALGAAVLAGRKRGGDGLTADDVAAILRAAIRLGELRGVAMKAGQLLGYIDVSLPPELRGLLSLLQTSAPASPFESVEATVREALGERAGALLQRLDRAPVAVASIGQVHHGRLPDGTEVAVKVRHPGILEAMRGDMRSARGGSSLAGVFLPGAGAMVKSFVDEARSALLEECDYLLEAERQATFARIHAGHPVIAVPAVEPAFCASAVLTTHWLPGRSLDAFLATDPPQAERDRIGEALFAFYVGTLYRHGVFHADPHPGNYAIFDGGRLAVYDFGCVRAFTPARLRSFSELVAAVRADARAGIEAALAGLGARPPRDAAAFAHLRSLLRGFLAPLLLPGRRPMDPGEALEFRRVLADKRALLKLDLPGELLFLFRLRFGLYAVLARLGAIADWAALESGWAAEITSAR